ncbi:pyridoxal-dependent decarboxylase domain-containing protein [Hyphomonas polymorpha PS728]|uniref:Pyridoxal-dependent decarboxylase domain-containing protein n=1 Tax=Hyphomonas polymorpha PS728 TaxID=1280954 RepID=A0A062VQ36_9PROT|nr:aspartate aminotransferase family protein [Hyphomonas polymorpha]KDA00424.1 pyridoxal-dependent decarboxylase domain-containing protein [Hyphomonas polymorpha PS728]
MQMPKEGRPWDEVRAEMLSRGAGDVAWREGKTAVYVFNAGEDVHALQHEAYGLFMAENGLGPLAFPSLAQMEKDVISMALGLLHGPEGAAGAITSGGTDSITMAIKTARDYARANGKPKDRANIVIPRSGHLAFHKAALLMDIEIRSVPLKTDGSYEADPAAMAEAIDEATIMMVGSAPNFPHGIIDPIAELGKVAEEKGVWLHVDACVGGYFAPFARMNGVPVPDFDFAVPAVKSMSADLHKYGYCAKGASTVLFRSAELYKHMPFTLHDWSGAPMKTPTLAGTRPGGAISAAWAVMNVLGVSGYREKQGLVCQTRERIEDGVRALGFEVLGRPLLGLVAFRHPEADTLALYSAMRQRGWFTSFTVEPPSLHLMLSPKHAEVADDYLADLAACLEAVKAGNTAPKVEARYS